MTTPSGTSVHIGQVAEATGLSHRTIRYYEEMGLIAPSARTDGGFRLYGRVDIDRLLLIKPMKPLGFSIEQIRQLLTALDTLADPPVDDGAQDAAREVVAAIHAEAQERVVELKTAARQAEDFTRDLGHSLPLRR